jgi:hypothetical protein
MTHDADDKDRETEGKPDSWFSELLDLKQAKPSHRRVYVVMPFSQANDRRRQELDEFYLNTLKAPLEADTAAIPQFVVQRSSSKLRINNEMMNDLATADFVIADLSGPHSNPNVMYELGVRFAISHKPVILIREDHADNLPIFDVGHLHIQHYDPTRPLELAAFIKLKIGAFETGEEIYVSPVLEAIELDGPLHIKIGRDAAIQRLNSLKAILDQYVEVFGNISSKVLTTLDVSVDEYCETNFTGTQPPHQLEKLAAHFASPPEDHACGAYLASPFLKGLLPDRIVEQFDDAVRSYTVRFFVQRSHWCSQKPLLAIIRFVRATLLMGKLVEDMQQLLIIGFDGPIDIDQSRRGWIAADHLQFVVDLQEYLADLYDARSELLRFFDENVNPD